MTLGLLGKKLGMTRIYDAQGSIVPVTVIQAGPCPIIQIKSKDKDGYSALQVGFDNRPPRNVNKPELGHFKRAGIDPLRLVREFRIEDLGQYQVGQALDLDLFEVGEKVDVIGISKGRGFAGVQKRHHASRGPETHGSMYHRRPGSGGASADPSHTWKRKKMPGHMGASRVTTLNLVVVRMDRANNLLLVRGSVPGHNNSYLVIRKSIRARRKAVAR